MLNSTHVQAKAKKEVDSSIHVAIEDLHFHMRKCKEEGENLKKQKDQLLLMLENKKLTTRQLQHSIQQLERSNSELQEKVRTLGEENDRLRKENRLQRPSAQQRTQASSQIMKTRPFKHQVDTLGSESWEDLSMKLLEQMERDINDLQCLGEKVRDRDSCGQAPSAEEILTSAESPGTQRADVHDDREAIQLVQEMRSQLSTIKVRLLLQKTLLQNAVKDRNGNPKMQQQQPPLASDDLFRVFFTQQLSSNATKKNDGSSGKQCPMCEEVLPPRTSQAEYEQHVMSHLGAPSHSHRF